MTIHRPQALTVKPPGITVTTLHVEDNGVFTMLAAGFYKFGPISQLKWTAGQQFVFFHKVFKVKFVQDVFDIDHSDQQKYIHIYSRTKVLLLKYREV